MKKYLIGIVVLILIVSGAYYLGFKKNIDEKSAILPNGTELDDNSMSDVSGENNDNIVPVDEKVVTLSIVSISGPTSLKIGETGNWTAKITAPIGTNLKYQIEWGGEGEDGIAGPFSVIHDPSKPISFSHAYSYLKPYNYTLIFKIWDANKCSPIFNVPNEAVIESQKCIVSSQIKISVGN